MQILMLVCCFIAVVVITALISIGLTMKCQDDWFKKERADVRKFELLFNTACEWIKIYQKDGGIGTRVIALGYKKVAIYGMQILGDLLEYELTKAGVVVAYGIDRNADLMYKNMPVVNPEADYEEVDVIIVTALSSYNQIEEYLRNKTVIPVISLGSLLQ